MKKLHFRMALCLTLLFLSCGEKKGEAVTVTFYGVPVQGNVVDVWFLLKNVDTGALFFIPTECTTASAAIEPPAYCGKPYVSQTTVGLGTIPIGASTYQLYVFIRDGTPTTLFSGKSGVFVNDGLAKEVPIQIQTGKVDIT
jgi:hypothetical protein